MVKTRNWVVWVGGIDDHYATKAEALAASKEWKAKGYDDVQVETCLCDEECK
tara:strand:- start:1564 stop:1719 length:156 start_codon:yes stop_codon:yes gene_type:complete